MKIQRLVLSGLLVLLVLAAVGLVLTNSWKNGVSKLATKQSSAETPVDESPIRTAQQLAKLAVTSDEQQYAGAALQLADHEVDMAFNAALHEASGHPPVLSPEAKALEARIERRQARVDAEKANLTRLTELVAKAPASRKDALQQELTLEQAQESLDEDELGDAHQDFIRAGGDPRNKIQQALQQYEQSVGNLDKGIMPFATNSYAASVEQTTARNMLAEFRAWKSLNAKQPQIESARQEALKRASAFVQSHDALEKQIQTQQTPGAAAQPGNSSATTAPPTPAADGAAATAAQLARVHKLSDDQRILAGLDLRIEDEQTLAGIYGKWSALVFSRERMFLRELLESVFWILVIAVVVSLSDLLVSGFFLKHVPDRKRFLTLRSVVMVSTRVIGIIVVLLVIFGVPNQFATALALAGAGLTVALKDFIVGFFGWFVLMGSNGIRPGDWVEINGVGGEVLEVGLLRTVLLETGDWSDAGHPTGRKVTFVNSFAIEGHYFNFSTSGQWMWDELQVEIPGDQDPYPIADEIKRIVAKETDANARVAEKEWERVTLSHGSTAFKAEPAMNLRPKNGGVSVAIRYITRANERHELRARLYRSVLELLHSKKIPEAAEKFSSQPVPETK
ncbi:MAG TPA: mechanosensitive ion channel domain-containing protein [Candidatus Acidoferrales bacterium]|nr:mechanosensitive ion channel domain-containing protein [Candidatus Acidoferrales bacterium]